jgi:hypothetical protein
VQATFLLATSILERLATFARGARRNPTDRVLSFGASPSFAAAVAASALITSGIRRSDRPSERSASPVERWYYVRSNALHRGKAAFRDAELVRVCLIELQDALRTFVLYTRPQLADTWTAIEGTSQHAWRLALDVDPPGLVHFG